MQSPAHMRLYKYMKSESVCLMIEQKDQGISCGTCAFVEGPFFGETLASTRPGHAKMKYISTANAASSGNSHTIEHMIS